MRKSFTTTIEESIQNEFRKTCISNDIGMNDILEALMEAYIKGHLEVKKVVKTEYSVSPID